MRQIKKKENSEIDLKAVNELLSGLDKRRGRFGDFDDVKRELRLFNVKEEPFDRGQGIHIAGNSDYGVKPPEKEFDYMIVDTSDVNIVKFAPAVDVMASVTYDPV